MFQHLAATQAVFGITRRIDYRIIGMNISFININVAITVVLMKNAFTDSIQFSILLLDV